VPAQIVVCEALTETEGTTVEFTLMAIVALLVQLPDVPITVYVILPVGVAVTLAPVAALSVPEGDQE
jgi:hypothetical protein